ncbi:hypothetical protein EVAR_60212_1 [Eumeta japonica]|uniref:Uncharacterized protein n=1 Tax=Eumeta variegata TaxID=151549 RepID=A0A4C1Z8Q5_EUMVA|nr:hypothetical protein EVAR_60212_1 [Eumeta japonica]
MLSRRSRTPHRIDGGRQQQVPLRPMRDNKIMGAYGPAGEVKTRHRRYFIYPVPTYGRVTSDCALHASADADIMTYGVYPPPTIESPIPPSIPFPPSISDQNNYSNFQSISVYPMRSPIQSSIFQ